MYPQKHATHDTHAAQVGTLPNVGPDILMMIAYIVRSYHFEATHI